MGREDDDTEPMFALVPKEDKGPEPKNNDKRARCWWCMAKTEKRGLFKEYDVCKVCKK